jgi:hypothetical protein
MNLYTIANNTITCHLCGATSSNPNDIEHHYCGRCHRFLDDIASDMEEEMKPRIVHLAIAEASAALTVLESLLAKDTDAKVHALLQRASVALDRAHSELAKARKEAHAAIEKL